MQNLTEDSVGKRTRTVERHVTGEQQKPNLRGFKVYIGDFVDVDDPGNDPPDTSPSSPPFVNGFGYLAGAPLWFAHGLDGETDMGGSYDLISGSPVSGTVAWVCPSEWRSGMQTLALFAVKLEAGVTAADDIYGIAVQVHDPSTGNVRVYWPLVATAYP